MSESEMPKIPIERPKIAKATLLFFMIAAMSVSLLKVVSF